MEDHNARIAKSLLSLDEEQLKALQRRFTESKPSHAKQYLTLDEFVEAILELLGEDKVHRLGQDLLIASLARFFEQIDYDGNGKLEWDEFCTAVIAAGLVASKAEQNLSAEEGYEEISLITPRKFGGEPVEMFWDADISMLLCVAMDFIFALDSDIVETWRIQPIEKSMEHDFCVCACVIAEVVNSAGAFVAVGMSNRKVLLYDVTAFDDGTGEMSSRPHCIGALDVAFVPGCMSFCKDARSLFIGSSEPSRNGATVCALQLGFVNRKGPDMPAKVTIVDRHPFHLHDHGSTLSSTILTPLHRPVITAATDGNIFTIDPLRRKSFKKMRVHDSVKRLAYVGDGIFASVGYTKRVYFWSVDADPTPVMMLKINSVPMDICVLPRHQIVVVDDRGECFRYGFETLSGRSSLIEKFHLEGHYDRPRRDGCPAFSAVATIGATLVAVTATNGYMFHLLAPMLIWRKGARGLSCFLFNPLFFEVALAEGNCVLAISAISGKKEREFKALDGIAANAEITAMALSNNCRNIIISHENKFTEYIWLSMQPIRECQNVHRRDISALYVMSSERIVVTGGWDRRIAFFDERDTTSDLPLKCLREIRGAHQVDVTAIAISEELYMLASGSADGEITTWYFEAASVCDEICGPAGTNRAGAEITALTFVEPYDLLVSCDASGMISSWRINMEKGPSNPGHLLATHRLRGEQSITCAGLCSTEKYLYYGCSDGHVGLLDCSFAVTQTRIGRRHRKINPRKRLINRVYKKRRDVSINVRRELAGEHLDDQVWEADSGRQQRCLRHLRWWRGHRDAVRQLEVVEDHALHFKDSISCVVITSCRFKIRVWNSTGDLVGRLPFTSEDMAQLATGSSTWGLPFDESKREEHELEKAENVAAKIAHAKEKRKADEAVSKNGRRSLIQLQMKQFASRVQRIQGGVALLSGVEKYGDMLRQRALRQVVEKSTWKFSNSQEGEHRRLTMRRFEEELQSSADRNANVINLDSSTRQSRIISERKRITALLEKADKQYCSPSKEDPVSDKFRHAKHFLPNLFSEMSRASVRRCKIEQLGPDHELKDAVLARLKRQQDRDRRMKARKAKAARRRKEKLQKLSSKSRSASTSHVESVGEGVKRGERHRRRMKPRQSQSLSLLLPDIIVES